MRDEDKFTSTVEGAAGFERMRAEDAGDGEDYSRPTRAEAEREAAEDREREGRS